MPSSGLVSPRARLAWAARAAARPRSKSRTQTALILPSWRSMRPIASCASSTAETFFALSADEHSTAVLKLHSDLAKAFSRYCFCEPDDAQFLRGLQEQ